MSFGLLLKLKVAVAINLMITGSAAIVTLGACACIFSGKAGTLHRMTVQSFWLNGSFEMLCGAVIDRAAQHPVPRRQRSHRFRRVLRSRERERARARARERASERAREGERERERARESSARVAAEGQQVDEAAGKASGARPGPGRLLATLRRPRCSDVVTRYVQWGTGPRLYGAPFNSTNKHALCVVHPPSNEAPGKRYVLRKGAPESAGHDREVVASQFGN